MSWFKVDDGFWSNPKVLNLSDAATALWVRAGSYCCQHLTDGVVLSSVLRVLGSEDAAHELVAAGLWKSTRQGFEFHDWSDYQETSAAVKKRREEQRERQRKRRASRDSARNVTQHVTRDNGVTTDERHAPVTRECATPDPTRPGPARPDLLTTSPCSPPEGDAPAAPPRRGKATKATRIPDGWAPGSDLRDQMHTECPGVDLDYETRKFTDYWAGVSGQRGTKKDWGATWRNWIRRAGENTRTTASRPQPVENSLREWGVSQEAADVMGMDWGAPATGSVPPADVVDAEIIDVKELGA